MKTCRFLLFTLCLWIFLSKAEAVNPNDLIIKSLFLNDLGYQWIDCYLDQTERNIYENDPTFIKNFPFNKYRAFDVKKQGTFFINNINDIIKNCLRTNTPWETNNKRLIEKYVKKNTIALDIGAHIGTHTVTMSHCVGDKGTVLAFEPGKTIYRELCYNLAVNQCENVYPLRCAVGKNKSTIEVITSHPNNEGGSYVIDTNGGSNSAILLPLDVFELNNVSFMKIDVENMEADVLDGAIQTIQRNRPVILIEIQGNHERPIQLKEDSRKMARITKKKLWELGYRLVFLGIADYLALPKEK